MLRVDFDTTITGPQTRPVDTAMAAPATATLPAFFSQKDSEECPPVSCNVLEASCLRELQEMLQCRRTFQSKSAGAVSPALLAQALHALWRADYFNLDNAGSALGLSLPGISRLDLDPLMPPAVFGTSTGVRVFIGPVATKIEQPGQPTIQGALYARIDVPVVRSGDRAVAFGTPNVTNVGFDPRGVSGAAAFILPPIVESAVESALETNLRRALSGVGPIAIPAYRIPSSLAEFGLPANAEFGVSSESLEPSSGFLTLIGHAGQL
jgi:hypothetical protein